MKNIKCFVCEKYNSEKFEEVENFVYKNGNPNEYANIEYSIPITFEQEPKFGEGKNSKDISQYPLEDVLDEFFIHVSDFFDELNTGKNNICYLELSGDLQNVLNFKNKIIGKRVFNKIKKDERRLIIK